MESNSSTNPEEVKPAMPDMMAMFMAAIREMSAENRETTLEAIREMKKLSPEDQAKFDLEKSRSMDLTMRRVDSAIKSEKAISERQKNCTHLRPDGKTNLRGQVLSNGYSQAFCSYCHYLSKPFHLTVHELTGGLNMEGWGGNALAVVENRVSNSPAAPPIPDIPAGAYIEF
jgi:hypothetical protein